jgi:two-component system response regulator DesR
MTDAVRSPQRLRVLVVDDHDIVHWGFRLMLSQHQWVERCVGARSGHRALDLARRYRPHVALVELFVDGQSGVEICERLRAAVSVTRVLLISGRDTIAPSAAREAGASGFASKDWRANDITAAVRMVGLGQTAFRAQERPTAVALSRRERQVLELIAAGSTNAQIAGALCLSTDTIKEHASRLYRKLRARNRTDAVQRALRLGLLV